MSNAVVTGTVDLASLETKSTDAAAHKFTHKVVGNLVLNGVRVSLHSDSADHLVKTVNRWTPQSNITASVGASTSPTATSTGAKAKYLVMTSPEEMRLDGDQHTLTELGLTSCVTAASTSATAAST